MKLSVAGDGAIIAMVDGRMFQTVNGLEQYLEHLAAGSFVYWHLGGIVYAYPVKDLQRDFPIAARMLDYSNKVDAFCTDKRIDHDADISTP